jgi:hypothetical protein
MTSSKPLLWCASSACCLALGAAVSVAGAALAIWALPALVAWVWAGLPF